MIETKIEVLDDGFYREPNRLPKRYVDVPEGERCREGTTKDSRLVVRTYSWQVQGPTRTHTFHHEEHASVHHIGVIVDRYVIHEGAREDRQQFGWGHSVVDAYTSSAEVRRVSPGSWYGGLIGLRVLREDLPCCGGHFVLIREHVDYSTLQIGHCDACGARWSIADGSHFDMEASR